jgi:hypothetical protein
MVDVAQQLNLRFLLDEWDPIGVADIAPDEYDCLIGPLLVRLEADAGRAEISEYLWSELENHFGLDPARCDVDAMANRLVAWWAAAGAAGVSDLSPASRSVRCRSECIATALTSCHVAGTVEQ